MTVVRPSQAESALYRAALRDVNTLAQRDLLTSWREFRLSDAAQVRDGLMDVLPGIIDRHHLMASTVAADWYDLMRYELGASGRFRSIIPNPPTSRRGAVLARWGVAPLFGGDPEVAAPTVLAKVSGGLQRAILDGARLTITGSAVQDPARVGWVRVGNGECDWCADLLDGEVHYVEGYDFDAHDHCRCDAVIDVS